MIDHLKQIIGAIVDAWVSFPAALARRIRQQILQANNPVAAVIIGFFLALSDTSGTMIRVVSNLAKKAFEEFLIPPSLNNRVIKANEAIGFMVDFVFQSTILLALDPLSELAVANQIKNALSRSKFWALLRDLKFVSALKKHLIGVLVALVVIVAKLTLLAAGIILLRAIADLAAAAAAGKTDRLKLLQQNNPIVNDLKLGRRRLGLK